MSEASTDDPSPRQVKAVIAATALLGLALVGFGGALWVDHQAQAGGVFERTEATIVSSGVEVDPADEGYRVDITYEYTVDGEVYRSSNVFPGTGEATYARSRAREIAGNHPENRTETAYYDPADPSTAYLVQHAPPWGFILLSAGLGGVPLLLANSFRGWLPD